ncbi:MAG: hypothetical protein ABI743_13735, partial [bacterium]
ISSGFNLTYFRALTAAPASAADWTSYVLDNHVRIKSLREQDGRLVLGGFNYNDTGIPEALRLWYANVPNPLGPEDWMPTDIGVTQYNSSNSLWPGLTIGPAGPWVALCDETGKVRVGRATTAWPTGPADWVFCDTPLVDVRYHVTEIVISDGRSLVAAGSTGALGLSMMHATTPQPALSTDWVTHTVPAFQFAQGPGTMIMHNGTPLILSRRGTGPLEFDLTSTTQPASYTDWWSFNVSGTDCLAITANAEGLPFAVTSIRSQQKFLMRGLVPTPHFQKDVDWMELPVRDGPSLVILADGRVMAFGGGKVALADSVW